MASQSTNQVSKPQMSQFIVAAICIVALIVGLTILGRHYFTPAGPSMTQALDLDKHPLPDWVNQDAVQCQGDISKLAAGEQQKLFVAYPNGAARTVIMAAYSARH